MRTGRPKGRFRRRVEFDGTWWAEDQAGAWFVWSRTAADWLPAGDPPAIPPPAEPEADPWREQTVRESLVEFFGSEGPGRNLLLALLILAGITGAIWAVSFVFDPFGIQKPRDVFWLLDVYPTILAVAGGIAVVVSGIIRVSRGQSFFPPEVRTAFARNRPRRDWRREVAKFLTLWTGVAFLMWWLLGYLKPFGILPFEIGPWEHIPPLLYLALVSAALAAIAWTWALRRPPPPPESPPASPPLV